MDEKERLKRDRMAVMMAGFDIGAAESENERAIRNIIDSIDELQEKGEPIHPESIIDLRRHLLDIQGNVRQAEMQYARNSDMDNHPAFKARHEALTSRLKDLQADYEAVLEGKLDGADAEAIREKLTEAYGARQQAEAEHITELEADLERRADQIIKIRAENEELTRQLQQSEGLAVNGLQTHDGESTVSRQIAEFDAMKKSLMRDLQNRCERVRISLSFLFTLLSLSTTCN
jgi:kinesin family protein 5